ncbi:MAG: hypothetical protein ACLFWG_00070 [Longimicrobiales bacterium]
MERGGGTRFAETTREAVEVHRNGEAGPYLGINLETGEVFVGRNPRDPEAHVWDGHPVEAKEGLEALAAVATLLCCLGR